jgi:hypothetical protein
MPTTKKTPKPESKKDKPLLDRQCPIHGTDMIVTGNGLYCPYCTKPGWGD